MGKFFQIILLSQKSFSSKKGKIVRENDDYNAKSTI